jgi:sialate O-acetylesterase
MIAPIIQYPIRGVIWYQGESNAGESYKYRRLFPSLIKDWRSKWGYEFPFFWVQLANYMKPSETPSESGWAELREAQHMTLSVPKTGEAVIIDIGEADDIHPRNKKDVGIRLALQALKVEYGKEIVSAGPEFKALTVEGNQALLTFINADGLIASKDKYGHVRGFAVAGEDKKFYWAKAYIKGDKVVVFSDSVSKPVAVRYAWGDNPDDANLYNSAGLPASPFRTDTWKGVTADNGK